MEKIKSHCGNKLIFPIDVIREYIHILFLTDIDKNIIHLPHDSFSLILIEYNFKRTSQR
jgi:hypothetical protein